MSYTPQQDDSGCLVILILIALGISIFFFILCTLKVLSNLI